MRYQVVQWDEIDERLKEGWIEFNAQPCCWGLVDTICDNIIEVSEKEGIFDEVVNELNELNEADDEQIKFYKNELEDVYRHLGFSDWIVSGHAAAMIHEDAKMEIRPNGYGKWIVADLSNVDPFPSQSFDSIGGAVKFVIEENLRDFYGP